MGAKKVNKDWWKSDSPEFSTMSRSSKIEVIKSEDLPELMTIKEVAEFFKCHPKTVSDWIARKQLASRKIMGRRFVTPQQISYFIETQQKKNG